MGERWNGWLYLNPDTGTELHENHPVRSGECEDAEHIRPATREALRDELLSAWRALAEQEADHAEMFRSGSAERDRLAADLAAARAEVERQTKLREQAEGAVEAYRHGALALVQERDKARAEAATARDGALEEAARIANDQANEDRKLRDDGVVPRGEAVIAILTSVTIAKAIRAACTAEDRHDG